MAFGKPEFDDNICHRVLILGMAESFKPRDLIECNQIKKKQQKNSMKIILICNKKFKKNKNTDSKYYVYLKTTIEKSYFYNNEH